MKWGIATTPDCYTFDCDGKRVCQAKIKPVSIKADFNELCT